MNVACKVDETVGGDRNVRAEILGIWTVVKLGEWAFVTMKHGRWSLSDVLGLFQYHSMFPTRRRRVPVKDMKGFVAMWVRLVKGISVSHNKSDVDECEFDLESAMIPILTAPVKELREFYKKLCVALREDPEVPFFVWSMFEAYGEAIIKPASRDEVVELKTKLAAEIAELVEGDIIPDLKSALIGALKWRAPEQLEAIKTAVTTKKAKPRMVGRESCLFLEVGDARVML